MDCLVPLLFPLSAMESLDFLLNLNKLLRISLLFVMLLEMLVIQYLICRGTKDDLGMVQGTLAGMEEVVK